VNNTLRVELRHGLHTLAEDALGGLCAQLGRCRCLRALGNRGSKYGVPAVDPLAEGAPGDEFCLQVQDCATRRWLLCWHCRLAMRELHTDGGDEHLRLSRGSRALRGIAPLLRSLEDNAAVGAIRTCHAGRAVDRLLLVGKGGCR